MATPTKSTQTESQLQRLVSVWESMGNQDREAFLKLGASFVSLGFELALEHADPDGPLFGTKDDDALAEIVHDEMCSAKPYRDKCRAAARAVKRAVLM